MLSTGELRSPQSWRNLLPRQHALRRLRQTESLAAEAQRIAGIGTWHFDLEADELLWSDEVYRIFGRSSEKFRPTFEGFMSCVHPEDVEKVGSVQGRTLEVGGSLDVEHRIVRPDGEVRYVHERAQLVELDGYRGQHLVGTVQDVTERHLAEARLAEERQRRKEAQMELMLLSRQNAMGTMAATMAHELNQPLAAIANYATGSQRLLDQHGATNDRLNEALEQISANAERAGEIIRRIRNFTRRGQPELVPVDLREVVQEALIVARLSGVEGQVRLPTSSPEMTALADRVQVQQVVVNLVRNACEAIEGRPNGFVAVSLTDLGGSIEVCVEDNGPGVAADVVPRLFETLASGKQNGMGMGLSISRTIIEHLRGEIAYLPSPEGARFCFTLPKAP